ncbi:MFS transporter [Proteobacteria bacterium 005FR1]|nr:MFS transporter [Proteobacteria bacterium 005FR1]
MSESNSTHPEKKSSPFLEIFINVVIPTLILSYLSKEQYLGTKLALIVALAFPIAYGCKDLIGAHRVNFFSVLGVITVALTGGMGLLEIDPKYIAIKEAAIPGLIGLMTLLSLKTRYPLVKTFIYNDKLLQVDKIDRALQDHDAVQDFEKSLATSSILLACSFFVASATNYALAKVVLVSPPGTEAFNVELARMMALSYPVNVVPAMIVMLFAVFYLFRSIRKYTNLSMEEIFNGAESQR